MKGAGKVEEKVYDHRGREVRQRKTIDKAKVERERILRVVEEEVNKYSDDIPIHVKAQLLWSIKRSILSAGGGE